ncbi:MAG: hypothetical protein LQ342_008573 [Letrouitia transgressa]|nr:MAG: hypothetical protein LQ342_008573 [Letrouitia transgressa]
MIVILRRSSFILILLYFSSISLVTALYPTELIYQFSNGTWVENLVVRPSGTILTTLISSPEIYQIQPSSKRPDPELVYHFDGFTALLGITQLTPDRYQVVATNRSTVESGKAYVIPNTTSIYSVNFPHQRSRTPDVRLTTRLPDAGFPNGLATLNTHTILLADSTRGVVVAIDTRTGANWIAIRDHLLAPTSTIPLGVNGLKIHGNTLYFTNTGQNLLGRVDIDLNSGAALGPALAIAYGQTPYSGSDDLALDGKGDRAFLTNAAGHTIVEVDVESGKQAIVAGDLNSTEIAQPTAAAFGRKGKQDTLYVTTAGGLLFPINGDEIVGGQVVAVKVGEATDVADSPFRNR